MTNLDLADQIISLLKDRVPTEKELDTVLPFIAEFRRVLNQGTEEKVREGRLAEAEWWFTRVAMASMDMDPRDECKERITPLRAVPAEGDTNATSKR